MQKAKPTPRPNVCQIVTDRIIESLKKGVIPWEKPWKTPTFSGGVFPRNFHTGKPYRGVNVMLLWSADYSSPFWLTFKQAKELGGTVRKGEKSQQIVFYKQLGERSQSEDREAEAAATKERVPFVLTYYNVFNVEQCDGLQVPMINAPDNRGEVALDETCEEIVSSWENRPHLILENECERRAYYRPSTDSVHMPVRSRFVDAPHFYSTLFHELVHSTGHESRLSRTFGTTFGDELYSKEELIAEIGAAFLCAIAGIGNEQTDRNTTAYIQNWVSRLQQDNRLIIQAAASAQRAVDLISSQSSADVNEEEGAGESGPLVPFSVPLAA